MLRQRRSPGQKAQVMIEYALILGVMVLIIFAMSTMIKRASQGMIKVAADELGNQAAADQLFDDTGHLVQSYSSMRASTDKRRRELVGDIDYDYDDTVLTDSNALVNLGFTPSN